MVNISRRREPQRRFWIEVASGLSAEQAGRRVGLVSRTAKRWFAEAGGMAPLSLVPPLSGRFLSLAEREEISRGRAAGLSVRAIAARLGRHPSTISREIARNSGGPSQNRGYRAVLAQRRADHNAARSKQTKLAANPALRAIVQAKLVERWSPEQITCWLRTEYPDEQEMRVSHETIYRSLYVQGRGELRRELTRCLRTGRVLRKPRRQTQRRPTRITDMVMISERPAEADDRAVPGHWEGDLIIGKNSASAIGTLVERSTRYCLLLHLPAGRGAEQVRDQMVAKIAELPTQLWRSLTWDQGVEMARHRQITVASGLPIYFCDPHSPWQRGSNENTNGLLRQYFPKGTDLSVHSAEHLDAVAAQLNGRPRKTLHWKTPAAALNQLLSQPFKPPGVATTG